VIGEPEQARSLARIVFIENIANIDVDIADHSPGSFHHLIVGYVGGPRFLDSSVLTVGELRGKPEVSDDGAENGQRKQTAS
jgi:hypothetical protein